ncbi:MAG: prepilin-type N-terminal cleavage/methylation protein [Rickettsiaceae bacterium]|jgi:prepilin-type N-terminal cleavage/methylation domain-containing protein|nr:prepilin-type N-terminal cleavage/methylation protein [Rickettsiaceae bacterium]
MSNKVFPFCLPQFAKKLYSRAQLLRLRRSYRLFLVGKVSLKYNKNSGFSLVEMSVVIAVIAIIMGGVLKGTNLIESAKIRAIIAESSEYKISLNSFYAKYDQYPGDFTGAVAYWGSSLNADGDGDGKIEFVNTATTPVYEGYRAWQHMSYAKMLKSTFVGTQTTAAAVVEADVPKSRSGGGYFLEYGIMGITSANSLVLGMPVASATTIQAQGVFTPNQAEEIDAKADDGNPSTGTVRGMDGYLSSLGNCVTDPTVNGISNDDYYALTLNGKDCIISFIMLEQ